MNGRRGFTLIEMLTVIIIIAILAALLFPVIRQVRRSSQKNATQMEIANLGIALSQYQSDFARYPNDQCSDTGSASDKSGRILVQSLSKDKYFDFTAKRLRDGKFIDGFGYTPDRGVWWYNFDNNDTEDGANPDAIPNGEVADVNWNITNVNRTRCDVWSSGFDGVDSVVNCGGNYVTYEDLSALDGKDDVGNW